MFYSDTYSMNIHIKHFIKMGIALAVLSLMACSPEPKEEIVHKPSLQQISAFNAWLDAFKQEALAKGISPEVINDAFANVSAPNEKVIGHDHTQPEKTKTFPGYMAGFMTERKIDQAREEWESHRDILNQVEAQYQVPAWVLLSLWGTESHFGERQGSFSIIGSLTTLAYDGRRSQFFRSQLLDALTILQQEHIVAADLTGSWAGAMGQTQFMPSSFLKFAVDFDGDGKKDIWQSDADALASMANYLHQKGWNPKEGWGIKVQLPANYIVQDNKEYKPLAEWQKMGIKKIKGPKSQMARLVVLDNNLSESYLVFSNYDVIMDWNHSTYFATGVGLLADAIQHD
jgi:membrane-bound lytic murein transglycosylase B